MSFKKELLELLVALSPLLVSLVVGISKPTAISRWVGAVLTTATLAVVATGFSMMRFIAKCTNQLPACGPEHVSTAWQPGLIQTSISQNCFTCVPHQLDFFTGLAVQINAWTPRISVGAAGVCVLVSALILVRFARWSKAHYRR
jgi:hypothetical protein